MPEENETIKYYVLPEGQEFNNSRGALQHALTLALGEKRIHTSVARAVYNEKGNLKYSEIIARINGGKIS